MNKVDNPRFRCGNGVKHVLHGAGEVIALGLPAKTEGLDPYTVKFDSGMVQHVQSHELESFPAKGKYVTTGPRRV